MLSMHAMDACELLDADHVAVKHLFVDYARLAMAAPEGSGAERRELADRICQELTVHAQIEEELFYPALQRARREAGGLLGDAKREHQEAKDLVAQIQSYGDPDPGMDALVARLAQLIEHHVKEERTGLFPMARTSGLDLSALADELRTRQEQLMPAAAAA